MFSFEKMTFQDIVNLKKPVYRNTPIIDLISYNMVWIGMKQLANSNMIPDLVYKEDEDDNNDSYDNTYDDQHMNDLLN